MSGLRINVESRNSLLLEAGGKNWNRESARSRSQFVSIKQIIKIPDSK